jgi:hypothetical protein
MASKLSMGNDVQEAPTSDASSAAAAAASKRADEDRAAAQAFMDMLKSSARS